jgi:hypothetical protein
MRRCLLALALMASTADARTLIFEGVATHQLEPGVDPFVRLGDKLIIRFDYDPATQPRAIDAGLSDDPEMLLFGPGFSAAMTNGLRWSESDEYSNGFVLMKDGPTPSFSTYLIPTWTAIRPILRVSDSEFSIEPGGDYYFNTTPSLGFKGAMRLVFVADAVPEPTSWALMIAGFGLLGATIRASSGRARVLSI